MADDWGSIFDGPDQPEEEEADSNTGADEWRLRISVNHPLRGQKLGVIRAGQNSMGPFAPGPQAGTGPGVRTPAGRTAPAGPGRKRAPDFLGRSALPSG